MSQCILKDIFHTLLKAFLQPTQTVSILLFYKFNN